MSRDAPGCLMVVATPLGNLEDLSPRAGRALREADAIYAEDTRQSLKLLLHLGINRPLKSLHSHNEKSRSDEIVALVQEGRQVALLSDAGTPVVSDPGADAVASVLRAGLPVMPIAGPSALTAALSASGFGLGDEGVLFVGFLPVKGRPRQVAVERVCAHRGVVVIFEAPHRIEATLQTLVQLQAQRSACLCRELTKVHEEVRAGTVAELLQRAHEGLKGEITLVLGPMPNVADAPEQAQIDQALKRCLDSGMSARDAATAVAAIFELQRRLVYARCEDLKKTTS